MHWLPKLLITAGLIVLASELAKARQPLLSALFIALPLVSYLSLIWIYYENRDPDQIARYCWDIFWLVLPSLSFFIVFPLLLKRVPFVPGLVASTLVLLVAYLITMRLLDAART